MTQPILVPLPTTLLQLRDQVILPTLQLLDARLSSDEAILQLMCTSAQESGLEYRKQVGGPAHGLWQFEYNGVAAVMSNMHSQLPLKQFFSQYRPQVNYIVQSVYDYLLEDDISACVLARCLYWDDPNPLPSIGDEEGAWQYYLTNWEPGKPDENRWKYWYPRCKNILQTSSGSWTKK